MGKVVLLYCICSADAQSTDKREDASKGKRDCGLGGFKLAITKYRNWAKSIASLLIAHFVHISPVEARWACNITCIDHMKLN